MFIRGKKVLVLMLVAILLVSTSSGVFAETNDNSSLLREEFETKLRGN